MLIRYSKHLPLLTFAGVLFLTLTSRGYTSASIPASDVYVRLETFHGHVCAGSLFGARLE